MIPELARMAVVIKSQHKTSVMTGNYELGYTCGLLCRLANIPVPKWENPEQLQEQMMEALTGYTPADEREENVIHMLKFYHPDDTNDEQVKELFEWGLSEEHVWRPVRDFILSSRWASVWMKNL